MKEGIIIFMLLFSCLSCKDKKTNISLWDLSAYEYEWNFGEILNDSILSHTFQIYNPTHQPCTINHILTSCGCTTYLIEDSIIKSGKKTSLHIKFNPLGLNGEIIREVYLYSSLRKRPHVLTLSANAPLSHEQIKFKFKYKVNDSLLINLPLLYVGNVYQNKTAKGELEIVNISNETYFIDTELSNYPAYIKLLSSDSLPPLKPQKIQVIYNGKNNKDNFWGIDSTKIILKYNGETHIINSYAVIVPFPNVKSQNFARMYVQIENCSDDLVKIKIKNLGNIALNLYEIRSSHNIEIEKLDSVIPSFEERFIICKYIHDMDSKKRVEILSNDVLNPILSLEL